MFLLCGKGPTLERKMTGWGIRVVLPPQAFASWPQVLTAASRVGGHNGASSPDHASGGWCTSRGFYHSLPFSFWLSLRGEKNTRTLRGSSKSSGATFHRECRSLENDSWAWVGYIQTPRLPKVSGELLRLNPTGSSPWKDCWDFSLCPICFSKNVSLVRGPKYPARVPKVTASAMFHFPWLGFLNGEGVPNKLRSESFHCPSASTGSLLKVLSQGVGAEAQHPAA